MRFSKLQGCGNDYIYLDGFVETLPTDLADCARRLSDRHRGVGGDGLIVIEATDAADCQMRMWNADGSASEMCGNGLRCAAKLAFDRGHIAARASFATGAGILTVDCLLDEQGACRQVAIDMGAPRFAVEAIPLRAPAVVSDDGLVHLTLPAEAPATEALAVGMGNPHCVLFVDDPDSAPVAQWGPRLEHDPRFPNRTNVEFASRLADEEDRPVIRQRTWERGSGETLACGTGACATAVAAIVTGRMPPGPCTIRLSGGDLRVDWAGSGPVQLYGEAVHVFDGVWPESLS